MTQRARGNNNISIFDLSKMAENEKSLSQRRGRDPIIVRVESVTVRFCLNRSLWRTVSTMCGFELRDQLVTIGIKQDDWYLSEDRSLVLMADHKEFVQIKDNLRELLIKLYKNSPEQQPPIRPAEEPAAHSPPSSIPGRTV